MTVPAVLLYILWLISVSAYSALGAIQPGANSSSSLGCWFVQSPGVTVPWHHNRRSWSYVRRHGNGNTSTQNGRHSTEQGWLAGE
ncbi:hypothetical protein HD806DRAFT_252990 [Xylariaceae sp. AK1471]|nr:hypothetical protein HD806DRAFT_252990 [Xylariaceae sp. AK1471]